MRQIAEDVLRERYYQPGETCWGDVAERVGVFIGNTPEPQFEYTKAINNLELIPNSPCLMNAGTEKGGSLSACYAVPVYDSIGDIFDAVKACALIHKEGGGTGISLSRLRAKGTEVKGTGHMACLTGDTVVYTNDKKIIKKQQITIGELYERKQKGRNLPKKLRCMLDDYAIGKNELIDIIYSGIDTVYELKTELGYVIRATSDHRFLGINEKWVKVKNISVGDSLAVNGNELNTSTCIRCGKLRKVRGERSKYAGMCENCVVSVFNGCSLKGSEEFHVKMSKASSGKWNDELRQKMRSRFIGENNDYFKGSDASETTARGRIRTWYPDLNLDICCVCGNTVQKGADIEIHHIDENPYNNSIDNLQIICTKCHGKIHKRLRSFGNPRLFKEITFDKVISIVECGKEPVYDIQMKYPYNNFIANGFVSHNSGPVSFMHVFNAATETIKQGGKRRGANLGSLDVHHPDIKEFITCKSKEGELSNFNISVIIDDAFMNNPDPEIMDLIIEGNWRNGEPGILFKEARERDNKRKDLGELSETNPCLHEDTLIFTSSGIERISDVTSTSIWNGEEYSIKTKLWSNGIKDVVRILTQSGFEYVVTPDHKFMLEDGSWCEARLLCGKKIKFNSNEIKSWSGRSPSEHCNYEILGFEFGDGTYHKASGRMKYIFFTPEKDAEVIDIISREFQASPEFDADGKRLSIKIPPHTKYASAFIGTLPERMIPDWILRLPKDDMRLFIRGLFSANGCNLKKYNKIQLVSSNRDMLKQMQMMLLAFGIKAKLWYHNEENVATFWNGDYTCKKSWHLVLSCESYNKYLDEIGFIQSYKNGYKRKREAKKESKYERVVDVSPCGKAEVWDFNEPNHHYASIGAIVHNCGETALFPWESCNLASINLMSCFIDGEFDWCKFEGLVRLGVRFLNDMIDKNRYPLPQIEEATKKTRKIGLGVMGFADLLIALGMRYGDEDSLKFADKLFRDMREVADDESQSIGGNNAALLSLAPTGTISLFAGVSSGIEPNFGYVYNRSTWAIGEKTTYREVHPMFEEIVLKKYVNRADAISDFAMREGSISECSYVNNDLKHLFVTAKDISPMDHVRMQATIQMHVDQAISKSINCAYETTKEEISDLIKFAWESGCKGLTIYREGSRSDVVLETNATKKTDEKKPDKKEPVTIPREIDLKSIRMNSACGILWVKTGFLHGCSDPIEVWVDAEKGGCRANLEFIGRLVSKMLQEGINYEVACKQGDKVFCSACVNNVKNESEGYSCANLISKGIKEGIKKREEDLKTTNRIDDITYADRILSDWGEEKCPDCGAKLNRIEGCFTCSSCGYSRCK